jgi:hypothetical protein
MVEQMPRWSRPTATRFAFVAALAPGIWAPSLQWRRPRGAAYYLSLLKRFRTSRM